MSTEETRLLAANARMRAALIEARAMIMVFVSNAMLWEVRAGHYDPLQHPVVRMIDEALAVSS